MAFVSLRSVIAGFGSGDVTDRVIGSKTAAPGGIESLIEFNQLFMNQREWIDTYVVTDLLGTDDADVRDSRELNPEAHGETPGNAFYGGRTINLQGTIQAKTLWKMQDMKQALRTAFADISVERPLIIHGATLDQTYYIMGKKSQKIDIPEKQETPNSFNRKFSVMIRCSLPWFLSYKQNYVQYVYQGSDSVSAIVFNVVNEGNFEARPYFELYGPMINPTIINEANGSIVQFNGTIPSGEIWVVDFTTNQPRVFRKSDGLSLWNFVSGLSTEITFDPKPSNNQVYFSATGMTVDSKIGCWWRHTVI